LIQIKRARCGCGAKRLYALFKAGTTGDKDAIA
jgi:acyl-CoA-binding protein